MKKSISIFLFLLSFASFSQETKTTEALITETVENYFYGYINRDLEQLKKAFDLENGTMKVPLKKGETVIGFVNMNFKELVSKWGNRDNLPKEKLDNCRLSILSLDIVDEQMAIVKILMKVDTITYIDLLSVQKIQNDWKITNKTYTVRD